MYQNLQIRGSTRSYGEVIDGKKRQVKITMNQAIVAEWAEKRPGMYQQGSHRGKPNSSPLQSLRKILPGLMSIMQLIIQGLEMC